MKQMTYTSMSYDVKEKRTQGKLFLVEVDAVIPWAVLESFIESY
ncbi:MAG: hypothetical protein AB7S56_07835 [Halothiobacillaceae bacterium]